MSLLYASFSLVLSFGKNVTTRANSNVNVYTHAYINKCIGSKNGDSFLFVFFYVIYKLVGFFFFFFKLLCTSRRGRIPSSPRVKATGRLKIQRQHPEAAAGAG